MKELLNFELSELLMLLIIPIGIMIYFILKLVKLNIINNRFNHRQQNYFILIEIFVWMVFGIWTLKVTLGNTDYYFLIIVSILLLFLLLIGWYVGKDFIAGVILKLSDNYQIGQFFRLNNIKGSIAQVNYLHLNVNQENGELIKVPFSKILGSIHHKSFLDDKTKQNKFEITIDKKETLDNTREKIRRTILLSAGVNINKEPIIIIKNTSENNWTFEITYFILDEEYCEIIENNVKSSI